MEQMRSDFEKYAAKKLNLPLEMIIDARNGDYYKHAFDGMNVMHPLTGWWITWRDSRAAVEIELPPRKSAYASGYGDGYLVEHQEGEAIDYEYTVEILRAAGLRVKEK